MKKILIPVDFSEGSEKAAQYGYQLAGKAGGSIVLFHAYHMPSSEAGVNYDPHTSEKVKKECEQKLRNLSEKLSSEYPDLNADVEIRVTYGFAGDEINNAIASTRSDLVVMNTEGAEGFIENIIGTVTAHVIKDTSCPVLVLPHGYPFKGIKNIVYATDLNDEESPVLKYVINIASLFGSHLYLLNVVDSDEDDDVKKAISYALENFMANEEYSDWSVHVNEHDKVLEGINEFARQHQADLVVLASRERSNFRNIFHKSISKRMSYHTVKPFLAMHKKRK